VHTQNNFVWQQASFMAFYECKGIIQVYKQLLHHRRLPELNKDGRSSSERRFFEKQFYA